MSFEEVLHWGSISGEEDQERPKLRRSAQLVEGLSECKLVFVVLCQEAHRSGGFLVRVLHDSSRGPGGGFFERPAGPRSQDQPEIVPLTGIRVRLLEATGATPTLPRMHPNLTFSNGN